MAYYEPVDLDAVDDDADLDADAATPERDESANPWDRVRPADRAGGSTATSPGPLAGRGSPPAGVVNRSVVPAVVRGAAIGAGAYTAARMVRRHPKAAAAAAVGVGVAMLPPAQRRTAIKILLAVAAVGVALIGLLLIVGINTPDRAPAPVAPTSPTSTSSCLWGSLC